MTLGAPVACTLRWECGRSALGALSGVPDVFSTRLGFGLWGAEDFRPVALILAMICSIPCALGVIPAGCCHDCADQTLTDLSA